jgi:hypothetical protein
MTKTSNGRRQRATTLKELKRLLLVTGDSRFGEAVAALLEHFPEKTKRGPKPEWQEFELMILWVYVQATMRTRNPKLSIRSACEILAKSKRKWPTGRMLSAGRLVSRYIEADKYMMTDPDSHTEADGDANALAQQFIAKRSRFSKGAGRSAAS